MGIFKRKRPEAFDWEEHVPNTKDVIVAFKQRLYEDPGFKDGFVEAMRRGKADAEQQALTESRGNTSEYGDAGIEMPDSVHIARGETFEALLHIFNGFLDAEGPFDPDEFLTEVRSAVGYLAAEAYFQGQIETPPQLKMPGSIGMSDPELGLIVVLDRWNQSNLGITEA